MISADNISSPQTQSFISNVVSQIKDNSTIHGVQNVFTIYSALDPILNQTDRATYQLYDAGNKTTLLLYGVPGLYLKIWTGAFNSTHNLDVSNQIAYNKTASALSQGNATAFHLYSSRVLNFFNDSWTRIWDDPGTTNYTVAQRASIAANDSNAEYVSNYLSSSKDFATSLIHTFTFEEFLNDTVEQEKSLLTNFAVRYVSNQTGLPLPFINSTSLFLGRQFDSTDIDKLAGNIVWNPSAYQPGPEIGSLISSFVSSSGKTTLVAIGLNQSSNENVLALRSIVQSNLAIGGQSSGIQSALVTGNDALNYDTSNSTQSDLNIILPVTIILLLVATGIFFRSVLTPFITLGTIGIALGIAQIFILIVGTYVAKVDFTIPTILITILIGVGTDYSVFIIARYREERVNGLSVENAIEKSVTWAGESIATSGTTVIVAFLSLSLVSIVYLRTIGLIVGLGVLVALFVALTLVPAIVASIGGRTFWPNSGRRFERYSRSVLSKLSTKRGYFSRSGFFSVKRAKVLILVAVLVTLPTLYVYFTTTPTYDFLSGAPNNLESISASNHLVSAFGGGRLFPSYVVITFGSPLWNGTRFDTSEMNTVQQISSYLSNHQDILNVTGPSMPYGSTISYSNLNGSLAKDNRTINSMLQNVGKDNKTALINIEFKIDPYSSAAINDAAEIRSYLHANFDHARGVTGIYVGGASGSILDTKNILNSQFNSILPFVAIGVSLVLFVVLGSLFLPLFAVASVLMSIIWTLAVTKIVFQSFYNYGISFVIPIFLFVTLLGLGMDYNIFILTRIREEASKGQGLNDAIIHAIEQTGGIITAAAIILAGSIGALMLSNNLLLKEIGFAFSFSILIDALVVRTYLVPAVMSSVGKWNWYNPLPGRKLVWVSKEYNPAPRS